MTEGVNNFSVPAGWPSNLEASVIDNCGGPLPNASVTASFSNGDPPLTLKSDGVSNRFSVTWQPGTSGTQVTTRVDAVAPALARGTAIITGTVEPNTAVSPSLAVGGILNNLNPVIGAAIAPGTVAQVYGDNLASAAGGPSTLPLPTVFSGAELIVGGFSAPLYYASKGQLTVQIPAELVANRSYTAIAIAGNQPSLPEDVNIVAVSPATVVFPDGRLVAQHGDFTLVDATKPAKPSEPLTIYLVGMGATNPLVKSGAVAPSSPLAQISSGVSVTVGGQTAELFFAGLTPGGIGLYQINFRVPANAPTGSLDVVITQNGVRANASKLVVAP
jgi:uncharacterized protein (TIGR03437 family)